MQWLIDIIAQRVIDTIGVPPCFIDRGDPTAYDYEIGDLTCDGAWHELDLSAIVPAGAKCILIRTMIRDNAVTSAITMKRASNVFMFTAGVLRCRVADIYNEYLYPVACNDDRKIEYRLTNCPIDNCKLTVSGWWL